MNTVSISDIGEIFYRLYESEINFRFENFWDGGYTWSVTGYEEESKNGEILWTRIELDNALDNFIMYPSEERDLTKVTYDEKRLARSGNMQKN